MKNGLRDFYHSALLRNFGAHNPYVNEFLTRTEEYKDDNSTGARMMVIRWFAYADLNGMIIKRREMEERLKGM